jgi:protein-S-isoprenylcysteine O-methyltransferase Ste14
VTEEEKTAAPITSDDIKQSSEDPFVSIGEKLFTWRDYTPIPLIFLVLFTAEPSVRSATIGTLIIMAGELLRIYSVAFIGSVSRTRNTTSAGANLITSGPFSWMRNPLYVGNFLITLGIAVFGAVSWVVLIAVLAFAFQYHCIVKYEEELLKKKFGQTYMTYMQDVPAWLPNKTPSLEGLEWPDTFTPALKSEKRTLSAVAIMLLALVLLGS